MPLAFRAQKYLSGLRYPARKNVVLRHAWQRGAGEDTRLSDILLMLPDRLYEDPTDLSAELGHLDALRPRKNARRP